MISLFIACTFKRGVFRGASLQISLNKERGFHKREPPLEPLASAIAAWSGSRRAFAEVYHEAAQAKEAGRLLELGLAQRV